MSLLQKQPKVNATADFKSYHKQWRDANSDRLRNVAKSKYYTKKFSLDETFLNLYGEYSGEVSKLLTIYSKLVGNNPELAAPILDILNHLGEN